MKRALVRLSLAIAKPSYPWRGLSVWSGIFPDYVQNNVAQVVRPKQLGSTLGVSVADP